jgi:hypothetical protein
MEETAPLYVYSSYSHLLRRKIWQFTRSARLSNHWGRIRFHRHFLDTLQQAIDAGVHVINELDESVEVDLASVSEFGLRKFTNGAPPLKRSKILLLAHLYCQITFPNEQFTDHDQMAITAIAQDVMAKLEEQFDSADSDISRTAANIFAGSICIEDPSRETVRIGSARWIKNLPSVLLCQTHRWRSDYPSIGEKLIDRYSYRRDGNVFYKNIKFNNPRQNEIWVERKSLDHTTELLFFLPWHWSGYTPDRANHLGPHADKIGLLTHYTEVYPVQKEAACEIVSGVPVVLLQFELDRFSDRVTLASVGNLVIEPTNNRVVRHVEKMPVGWGRGKPDPVISENSNLDIEVGVPASEGAIPGQCLVKIFRKIKGDSISFEEIFEINGWGVR